MTLSRSVLATAVASRSLDVQRLIRDSLGALDVPRGTRVSVDVDPYSFL